MGVVTGAYTQTFYAKAAERSWVYVEPDGSSATRTYYNLVGNGSLGTIGTGVTASIVPAGNGWYKLTCTYTFAAATAWAIIGLATANGTNSYAGDGTSGLYLYGAQLEAGAFATSYIPTVASTVSRSADVATMTGTNFSSWYSATAGTLVADYGAMNGAGQRIATISDGTVNNQLWLRAGTAGGNSFEVYTAGAFVAQINPPSANAGPAKIAGAFAANDFAVSVNGSAVGTDTSGALASYNRMTIGSNFDATVGFLNGHIRSLAYYNTRLPNTQLQTLTAPSLASPLALDFISPTYTVGY
jgi:hypothetical protein